MRLTLSFALTSRIGDLTPRSKVLIMRGLKIGAFDGQAKAQIAAKRDTGAMANSVYVVTDISSTYGEAVEAMASADREAGPQALPDNPLQVVLGVAANYAVFQDLGTRFMAGDAWFTNAVLSSAGETRRAIREALKEL